MVPCQRRGVRSRSPAVPGSSTTCRRRRPSGALRRLRLAEIVTRSTSSRNAITQGGDSPVTHAGGRAGAYPARPPLHTDLPTNGLATRASNWKPSSSASAPPTRPAPARVAPGPRELDGRARQAPPRLRPRRPEARRRIQEGGEGWTWPRLERRTPPVDATCCSRVVTWRPAHSPPGADRRRAFAATRARRKRGGADHRVIKENPPDVDARLRRAVCSDGRCPRAARVLSKGLGCSHPPWRFGPMATVDGPPTGRCGAVAASVLTEVPNTGSRGARCEARRPPRTRRYVRRSTARGSTR